MLGQRLGRNFALMISAMMWICSAALFAAEPDEDETLPESPGPPAVLVPAAAASTVTQLQPRLDFAIQMNWKRGSALGRTDGGGAWGGVAICVAPPALFLGVKIGFNQLQVKDLYGPDDVSTVPLLFTGRAEWDLLHAPQLTVFLQVGGGICINSIKEANPYAPFTPGPNLSLSNSPALDLVAGFAVEIQARLQIGLEVNWLASEAQVESDDPATPDRLEVGHLGLGAYLLGQF